ncbi:hypothetical protein PanWU01x14_046370 [Parasponia andersonii]|uniref:Uncharacterized protein n=1 Tax=Parasponia andersonii TaxID=3476 RepID=A0A2P5DNR3_PARAD|nr:hypothetical protein PanWU01x14_046370 [Parasponia andersonii]
MSDEIFYSLALLDSDEWWEEGSDEWSDLLTWNESLGFSLLFNLSNISGDMTDELLMQCYSSGGSVSYNLSTRKLRNLPIYLADGVIFWEYYEKSLISEIQFDDYPVELIYMSKKA